MATTIRLELRTYQKGDAEDMAAVFNAVMRGQPGFQEDSPARLEQVYSAPTFDPQSKQIALVKNRIVGYMTTTPDVGNPTRGNVNYPYVLPEAGEGARRALFDAGMRYLMKKGVTQVGTAYFHERWREQLSFFEGQGFKPRQVRYRVVEGPVPARPGAPAVMSYALRPAVPADFERMCAIGHQAMGRCADPPAIKLADLERVSAAPFMTPGSLTVAERDGELVGFVIAFAMPAAEGQPPVAMFTGPSLRPDAWDTPAREALWAAAVQLANDAGAKTVKSYASDAGTPETDRLLRLYADHGITGDELWVHLYREMP